MLSATPFHFAAESILHSVIFWQVVILSFLLGKDKWNTI